MGYQNSMQALSGKLAQLCDLLLAAAASRVSGAGARACRGPVFCAVDTHKGACVGTIHTAMNPVVIMLETSNYFATAAVTCAQRVSRLQQAGALQASFCMV